ncbi:hypothetical protein MUCCIDRAFT_114894 [Mucor lusitanicus CBS 277.49]|uniref:Uncharacterized protein n=1 Tax=Mucor lusitanicus CBS 277.49 TaxID=747725 RepID=A0A168HDA1_MUCCL|nr:hypothetical protein MUCCIDRAFT_114894 [Mucor lusitanicus CBS 277.49]
MSEMYLCTFREFDYFIKDARDGEGYVGQDDATLKRLVEGFWWPGCYEKIKARVKEGCKTYIINSNVDPKLPYLSVLVQQKA